MPKKEEYCEVRAGGRVYRDWTAVSVVDQFDAWARSFALELVEVGDFGKGPAAVKLKTGDPCDITLAGKSVIEGGYIEVRQVSYDARRHGIAVQGRSKAGDMVDSSVDVPGGQFRDYTLEAIANRVLKPFGATFTLKNAPEGAKKPIKDVSVQHGETVHEFLERISRKLGVLITGDEKGNLIGGHPDAKVTADLQEGVNILSAQGATTDLYATHKIKVHGQNKGSDEEYGEAASQIAAEATNPGIRKQRTTILLSEEPGTQKELQQRADMETRKQASTMLNVSIVVAGWTKPNGELWKSGEFLTVKSPMLFPNESGLMRLAVQQVTFTQDSESGTTSTLNLVLPQFLTKGMEQESDTGSGTLYNPASTEAVPAPSPQAETST